MPVGEEVASFATYPEAQRAVDSLSDDGFPVQHLAIIGTDLRQVERITGRKTWGRVLLSGAASGLWIGLFFAAMMALVGAGAGKGALVMAVLMGVLWGTFFQATGYALSRGRRDFTSVSQVVAARYSIIAQAHASSAAQALARFPGNLTRGGQAAVRARERRRERSQEGPTAFGSRPDEQPRFGIDERSLRYGSLLRIRSLPVMPNLYPASQNSKQELRLLPFLKQWRNCSWQSRSSGVYQIP